MASSPQPTAPPPPRIIGRRKSADIKEFSEFKESMESAINLPPKLSNLLNLTKPQLLIILFVAFLKEYSYLRMLNLLRATKN